MSSSIFEICERVDMPRVFSLRSRPSSMPSICCRSSVAVGLPDDLEVDGYGLDVDPR